VWVDRILTVLELLQVSRGMNGNALVELKNTTSLRKLKGGASGDGGGGENAKPVRGDIPPSGPYAGVHGKSAEGSEKSTEGEDFDVGGKKRTRWHSHLIYLISPDLRNR